MNNEKKFVIGILMSLFLISYASALYPAMWEKYGGLETKNYQAQYYDSHGNINQSVSQLKTSIDGQTFNETFITQPLVTDFFTGNNTRYLIIQSGTFLDVFNSDLDLVGQISTGSYSAGQIQLGDYNGDGWHNDIAGLYIINDTTLSMRFYNLNVTSLSITLINSSTFYQPNKALGTGVSCIGASQPFCVFEYKNNLTTTNVTLVKAYINGSSIENTITGFSSLQLEPLSLEDANNDGDYEVLLYEPNKSISAVTLGNGSMVSNFSLSGVQFMSHAKFIRTDLTNQYKIVYDYVSGNSVFVKSIRLDGSTLWTSSALVVDLIPRSYGMALQDYDNDNFPDVWIMSKTQNWFGLHIVNAKTGSFLWNKTTDNGLSQLNMSLDFSQNYKGNVFTLAKMGSDNTYDWVYSTGDSGIRVIGTSENSGIYNLDSIGTDVSYLSCVTADLNFDSASDIVCSNSQRTAVLLSNSTNVNAVMNSIIFSPSTTMTAGGTLDAIISCSDTESDSILYSSSCYSGAGYSESYSSTQSCTYLTAGLYNITLRCRDAFHTTYSQFSQNILVTSGGTSCNNNGICEVGLGETSSSCSSDCTTGSGSIGGENGTLTIPLQLVDTSQEFEVGQERGLLPEIYYGTLAFFSKSLAPVFLLVFIFFIALFILAIGIFIKRLASKF